MPRKLPAWLTGKNGDTIETKSLEEEHFKNKKCLPGHCVVLLTYETQAPKTRSERKIWAARPGQNAGCGYAETRWSPTYAFCEEQRKNLPGPLARKASHGVCALLRGQPPGWPWPRGHAWLQVSRRSWGGPGKGRAVPWAAAGWPQDL